MTIISTDSHSEKRYTKGGYYILSDGGLAEKCVKPIQRDNEKETRRNEEPTPYLPTSLLNSSHNFITDHLIISLSIRLYQGKDETKKGEIREDNTWKLSEGYEG